MSGKYLILRLFHIPIKLKEIFLVYYNLFIFWVNDIRYGNNLSVINRIYIKKKVGSSIVTGNNFRFLSGSGLNPLERNIRGMLFTQFAESKIKIGNNVGISSSCIWCNKSITIEDNVNIGADCILMDTDAHNLDYRYRNGVIYRLKR